MLKAVLLAGVILATPVQAQDDLGFTTFGAGGKSCGDWIRSEGSMRNLYISWVMGFLTAVNVYDAASGKDGNMPGANPRDFEVWITDYCNSHALEKVSSAAVHLAIELRKQ